MFGALHSAHITSPKLKHTNLQTLFKLISIVVLKLSKDLTVYVFSQTKSIKKTMCFHLINARDYIYVMNGST